MSPLLIMTCYWRANEASAIGAAVDVVRWACRVLGNQGPIAIAYVILGNLLTFGVLIVCCYLLAHYWNTKRLFVVLASGVIVATGAGWLSEYGSIVREIRQAAVFAQVIEEQWPHSSDKQWVHLDVVMGQRSRWEHFVWSYHPLALLAIPAGALIAMHPIFKPGASYYLRRGLCPKCEYDLQGKTDAGCPECGWNRPEAAAGDGGE